MAAETPMSSENLLHRLWSSFDPELQEALSHAYNQAKREGKTRISTRTFFAAVARLRPGRLQEFLDRLPDGSLPAPISEDVPRQARIQQEEPQLSTCVENALSHLGKKADPQHKLSTAEVFVDVAKHGMGASTAHLRAQGVTPEKIDQLVNELGWEVRER
jgi:ATP-dependent Clp protease ATP-binding subunit ClpA